jgi:hypothetical protein
MAEHWRVRHKGAAGQGERFDCGDRGLEDGDGVGAEVIEDPVQ